jgi:hypothetical protein
VSKRVLPRVTRRQLAAILAALRVCQHSMSNDAFRATSHWDGVGHPLSADEIDDLCEDLNFVPARGLKPAVLKKER